MTPKWPKMTQNGPKRPKMAQNGPKMAQNDPKWPQNGPKWPKMAQNGLKWPKMAPKRPKTAQNDPKMAPKWPKMVSGYYHRRETTKKKGNKAYNALHNLIFVTIHRIFSFMGDFVNAKMFPVKHAWLCWLFSIFYKITEKSPEIH